MRIAASATAVALMALAGIIIAPAAAQQTAGAAKPAASAAANNGIIRVAGKLIIHMQLQVGSSLPDGTNISVIIEAVANDDTADNTAETVSTSVTVSGGAASLTSEVPYTFNIASRQDTIDVTLDASGNATSGGVSYTNGRQLLQSIPIPKNGATTTVNLSGSI